MNTKTLVAVLVALIFLGAGVAAANWYSPGSTYSQKSFESTTTPIDSTPVQNSVLPYGRVTLALGQTAVFKDISITPISLEEDSRCPTDVQCIQAGTARVKISVSSGMGTSSSIVKLNELFTAEGESITLMGVTPDKVSTVQNTKDSYRFTFDVEPAH